MDKLEKIRCGRESEAKIYRSNQSAGREKEEKTRALCGVRTGGGVARHGEIFQPKSPNSRKSRTAGNER